jgi:hypothetical protein
VAIARKNSICLVDGSLEVYDKWTHFLVPY